MTLWTFIKLTYTVYIDENIKKLTKVKIKECLSGGAAGAVKSMLHEGGNDALAWELLVWSAGSLWRVKAAGVLRPGWLVGP